MGLQPADVSAVVCTLDSAASIERCLSSLRDAGVGELVVVDGGSTDGTRDIAERLADRVLDDPREGLGLARNIGIATTTGALILNCGSDNVIDAAGLAGLIAHLETSGCSGVGAMTVVGDETYLSRSMNAYRRARFRPGPAAVIGTPTLFDGDLLRAHPYDPRRQHSDDSELCERWARDLGASFAIAAIEVLEIGKATFGEVRSRCRNYGTSDHEVFDAGRAQGWTIPRQVKSLAHPVRVDLVEPLARLGVWEGVVRLPYLATITALRYAAWAAA
jgi:glycosyltransferase involved in cell wall biosynthesis